jgi:hypothetical protein
VILFSKINLGGKKAFEMQSARPITGLKSLILLGVGSSMGSDIEVWHMQKPHGVKGHSIPAASRLSSSKSASGLILSLPYRRTAAVALVRLRSLLKSQSAGDPRVQPVSIHAA